MATAAVSESKHQVRPGRYDRFFFSALAVLVMIAVFAGFARTYFLAGWFRAKLPNVIVHIHGALFTLWVVLLVAQVGLVAVRRPRWHMRLGVAGMFLAPLMVSSGFATLVVAIKRGSAPPPVARIITSMDTMILCLFAVLVTGAFLARRDAPTHKRLILFATFLIIAPAIARWPITHGPALFHVFLNSFPALLVAYDIWTRRSLHRATVWGVVLMAGMQLAAPPLARSSIMARTITWLQTS
jgi:hypothetical protein